MSVIVRDVAKMLSFAAQRKNLEFISDIAPEVEEDLVVLGDPGRVRQIITNLLTNSIKFTNQGFVKLSITKERDTDDKIELKFQVQDTGIGIDDTIRKRLFQPFSQGDASTARKFGGTGLGLTICKSLLELMHGRMTLDSVVNQGTTATFWVPFNKPHDAQPSNLVKIEALPDRLQSEMSVSCNSSELDGYRTPPVEGPMTGSSKEKMTRTPTKLRGSIVADEIDLSKEERAKIHVLVVEDNAINQQIATKTIKKLGFNVSASWNGREALDYLAGAQKGENQKPDIILMDVQVRLKALLVSLYPFSQSLTQFSTDAHMRRLQSNPPPPPPRPLQSLRPRCPHRRHDRLRHPRRPRKVPPRWHGRLPCQAGAVQDPRADARALVTQPPHHAHTLGLDRELAFGLL